VFTAFDYKSPFSAQQRTCIASGLTAARGTKRRVHIAPLRALNEQVSWFLLNFVVQPACPVHCTFLVLCGSRRAAQGGREPSYSYSSQSKFFECLNGGVLKLDITRANVHKYYYFV
jgi:hypothetical protein